MNIHAEKLQLVKMLLETSDVKILGQIRAIFEDRSSKGDIWDEWDDEVKADVEQALEELDRGEGIPHEKVMSEFARWRKK